MNTLDETQNFDLARALIMSHALEGSDVPLSAILLQTREICGTDALHRVLVLAAALDDPRFNEYGAADVLPLLRNLEITDDLKQDVETLLTAMQEEHAAALHKAAEESDPFRQAAIRLLSRSNSPTWTDVERELTRL